MDGRAQVKEQIWLNPENLVIFIDELKDAGFNIGVTQYIAAQDLVLALVTQGSNLDQQRFKNMLGSLLCSSPQEQKDFRDRFDQWVHRMGFAIAPDDIKGHEKARKLERELIKVREQSKNWKRIWLFVLGIAIFTVLGVSIAYFSSSPIEITPPENNQPPQITASPPTPIEWQSLLIVLFIILVTFLLGRWWWRRRANLFLKRNATTEEPKLQQISIADNDKQLFPDLLYLKIAQQFRKRIKVDSPEIDVERSFEKTLDSGGWFTPVYKTRQIPPEYLFLVDRTSYGDHQARFITEIIDRLVQEGVFINGYYFDNDPRICLPMSGQKYSCRLNELAAKYSQHRLVVFSEAERLFSPVTGELESWVEIFAKWQDRAVLTPKPMENWGFEEIELAEQFMILPATSEGLLSFIKNLEIESSTLTLSSKDKPPLPESLQERPLYWIDREPPEDYLIKEVLPSLKLYLGQDGYHWLSACAVFPELHWNLTLYLGNALKKQKGETLLQSCNISDLARLPWFRYGYMPDWLRLLLIAELSPEQDKNIREKLEQLLVNAVSGSVSGIQLEIAEKHRNSVSKITKPLLKIFTDKSSINSPLRDYIFQDFMTEKYNQLAVILPNNLRQIIAKKLQSKAGWNLGIKLILSKVLVPTIFWSLFIISIIFGIQGELNDDILGVIMIIVFFVWSIIHSTLQVFFLRPYSFKFNLRLKVLWVISNIICSELFLIFWAAMFSEINNFPNLLENNFQFSYIPYILFMGIILAIMSESMRSDFLNKIDKREKIFYLILSRCLDVTIVLYLIGNINDLTSNVDFLYYLLFFSGISSELFFTTTLVWILRQPVKEKKESKSNSPLSKSIIRIVIFISTVVMGLLSYFIYLQSKIDNQEDSPANSDVEQIIPENEK